MDNYALTQAAAGDIRQITRHSLKDWGLNRAKTYIDSLHVTFEKLAAFPDAGRAFEGRPGYLRLESGGHAVFYRKIKGGILIVRVLHQRMEPQQHL